MNVSFASGDVLSFNGGKNINVTGLSFNHSVNHTSGNNIEVTGGARNFFLRNITCYANHYSCVGVDRGAAVGYIENIYVPGEGQVGICLGCEATGLAADLEITGGDFNYQHRSAIEMQSASGITLRQFNTDFNTHGLWIHPPSGQSVGAIDTDNTVYFDYSTQEGVLVDASAGTVSENRFEGETWAVSCGAAVPAAFASSYSQPFTVNATAACVSLSGTAAFLINNDWNFQTFNAGGNGISLSGGTDNRVGGSVSQNGNNCTTANPCHGFAVGAGTSHWSWKGRAGGTNSNITVNGAINKQAYGVFNNGGSGSDYYSISGDLSGNAIGPLFDNGNGANKSYEGMWPPSPTQQGKNLLVDGNFTVNQRGYASGASVAAGSGSTPAAASYSFDHWFNPGTSATSYAFTAPATAENQASAAIDNVITIAAGGAIGQKVEERAVAGGEYALSCGGTASAAIVYVNNGNATVAATGTCGGAAIGGQVPVGATMQVQFTAPSGSTATLSTVELDYGPARAFERRPYLQDLQLCQRFFQIAPTVSGAWTSQASIFAYGVTFAMPMKSTPTASLIAAGNGVTDPGVANYAVSAVNAGYTSLTAAGGYIGLTTAVVPTARMPGIVQSNVVVGLSAEF